VKMFGKVVKLKEKGSRQLLNWVGTMSTKISDVAKDLKRKRSVSIATSIIS